MKHRRLERPKLAADAGVTMVELMIAILLAAIMTSGLFYMLQGQRFTYRIQMQSLTSQQNLWGAMAYLQRQVRMAGHGFGGCKMGAGGDAISVNGASGLPVLRAIQIYNNCNLLTTNPTACAPGRIKPDSFTVLYADPRQPAVGVDMSRGTMAGMPLRRLVGGDNDPICLQMAGNFALCDRIILWNPNPAIGPGNPNCALFLATSAPTLNTTGCDPAEFGITRTSGTAVCTTPPFTDGAINHPGYPGVGFEPGSAVIRLAPSVVPRHFAVDTSTTPPRLVTWTTWNPNPSADNTSNLEVVADGIEDMQIAYACDQNQNGAIEENVLALNLPGGCSGTSFECDEWGGNTDGSPGKEKMTMALCNNKPSVVRITLTARSAAEIGRRRSGRFTGAEDRPPGPIDQFNRAQLKGTAHTLNLR